MNLSINDLTKKLSVIIRTVENTKRRGSQAMILSEVQSLCTYDSLGRKLSRMDNETCEYYIYDGMNLVADYDAINGRITRTYSYGPGVDNIQSMTIYDEYGGSETYYYIKDASNTVYGLVDVNNEIVEYYHYDAFGNFKIKDNYYLWIPESAYGNRFLFQGREYDYDTALYYFRARWYEPETGRWLSPDPIGISGGLNLYAFCENDPVNYTDPMGTDVWVLLLANSYRTVISFHHELVMGTDEGGKTYWVAEKTPNNEASLWDKLVPGCRADKDFRHFIISPKDLPPGYKIVRHVPTTPYVDKLVAAEAKRRCEDSGYDPNYHAIGGNCRKFANSIADYAEEQMHPPSPPRPLMNRSNYEPFFYGFGF